MRLDNSLRWGFSLLLLGSAIACSACSDDSGSGDPDDSNSQAFVVRGRAVDTAGRPLPGAQVVADNQVLYDSNVEGVTGSDGTYRLELGRAAVTWNVSAQFQRQYNGRSYTFDLHPSDPNPFAANTGAVRDFSWRLTGARPQGGVYGSKVLFNLTDFVDPANPQVPLDRDHVELTLTPAGPLVDGSAGTAVTARGTNSPDGFGLLDVALGRYTITARYAPPGQQARPLVVRLNGGDAYAPSLTTDFQTVMTAVYRINLELKFP
jgi:hypothetical protein